MTDDTQRCLGRIEAGLNVLRADHDRHASWSREEFAALRKEVAETREDAAAARAIRHTVTAVIAIIAGLFGAHVPLPGGH